MPDRRCTNQRISAASRSTTGPRGGHRRWGDADRVATGCEAQVEARHRDTPPLSRAGRHLSDRVPSGSWPTGPLSRSAVCSDPSPGATTATRQLMRADGDEDPTTEQSSDRRSLRPSTTAPARAPPRRSPRRGHASCDHSAPGPAKERGGSPKGTASDLGRCSGGRGIRTPETRRSTRFRGGRTRPDYAIPPGLPRRPHGGYAADRTSSNRGVASRSGRCDASSRPRPAQVPPRRAAKNARNNAEEASASTPRTTSTVWLSRGSLGMS